MWIRCESDAEGTGFLLAPKCSGSCSSVLLEDLRSGCGRKEHGHGVSFEVDLVESSSKRRMVKQGEVERRERERIVGAEARSRIQGCLASKERRMRSRNTKRRRKIATLREPPISDSTRVPSSVLQSTSLHSSVSQHSPRSNRLVVQLERNLVHHSLPN